MKGTGRTINCLEEALISNRAHTREAATNQNSAFFEKRHSDWRLLKMRRSDWRLLIMRRSDWSRLLESEPCFQVQYFITDSNQLSNDVVYRN